MDWIKILGPTILVIIGGFITWIIQNRIQKLNKQNEDLREQRIQKYNEIINPIVVMYSKEGGGAEKATKIIQSYEYRKTSFELNFWGSDAVVNSYNNLMQFTYKKESDTKEMMTLLGTLLLEIRKDVGNSGTKLQSHDMLRSMITDIDNYI